MHLCRAPQRNAPEDKVVGIMTTDQSRKNHRGTKRHSRMMFYPALLALVGTSPWPPTGSVTALLPKLAISGLPRTMARCTEGSDSEARWLCSLSQTSVIQIAFASAGSFATT